jgi:hypothetical protein
MEAEDKDYSLLYERVLQMKMDELFSEPYDGDMEEEECENL